MAEFNIKPSQQFIASAVGGVLPQSVAAAGTVTGSSWVSAKEVKWAKVTSYAGAGAGTFAVKIQQATSSGGAGAKDLVTAANLGITAQANSTVAQADYNVADNIDADNSFAFIQLSVTCTGGAGTLYAGVLELGPAYRQG